MGAHCHCILKGGGKEENAGSFIFHLILSLVISGKVGKSNSPYLVEYGAQHSPWHVAYLHYVNPFISFTKTNILH